MIPSPTTLTSWLFSSLAIQPAATALAFGPRPNEAATKISDGIDFSEHHAWFDRARLSQIGTVRTTAGISARDEWIDFDRSMVHRWFTPTHS